MEYVIEAVALTAVAAYLSRDNGIVGEGGLLTPLIATFLNLLTALVMFLVVLGLLNLLDA